MATSATVAASVTPMPNHSIRSRWWPMDAMYRARRGASASTAATVQLMAPSTTVKGWWFRLRPIPTPNAAR